MDPLQGTPWSGQGSEMAGPGAEPLLPKALRTLAFLPCPGLPTHPQDPCNGLAPLPALGSVSDPLHGGDSTSPWS